MLFFLTGEGRVLRFVPLCPLGFSGVYLSVRLRVYSPSLLVKPRTYSPHHPSLYHSSGWYGVITCVLGNTTHTRAYMITIQPFGYWQVPWRADG